MAGYFGGPGGQAVFFRGPGPGVRRRGHLDIVFRQQTIKVCYLPPQFLTSGVGDVIQFQMLQTGLPAARFLLLPAKTAPGTGNNVSHFLFKKLCRF